MEDAMHVLHQAEDMVKLRIQKDEDNAGMYSTHPSLGKQVVVLAQKTLLKGCCIQGRQTAMASIFVL